MSDTLESYVPYWSIHSSRADQPIYRGWAGSESEAKALMDEIRKSDAVPGDNYWVIQMTESELEVQQAMGEIPRKG